MEVTESTTTATTGSTITVTTPTGAQVEDTADPIIQVTPVLVTLTANPGVTAEQLTATRTDSGLTYAANGQLNNLYNKITTAESTEQLLGATVPEAAAEFEATVGAPVSDYTHIALYDVAASASAKAAIAESGSAQMAISVPGVADSTQLVATCWDRNDNSRTVPVCVVNDVVYLTIYSSGPVMIMARVQG